MSWSVNVVGKPDEVIDYIEKECAKSSGNCKEEFEAAKPALIALVNQNRCTPDGEAKGYTQARVSVSASGSASWTTVDGKQKMLHQSVSVEVKPMYLNLVS